MNKRTIIAMLAAFAMLATPLGVTNASAAMEKIDVDGHANLMFAAAYMENGVPKSWTLFDCFPTQNPKDESVIVYLERGWEIERIDGEDMIITDAEWEYRVYQTGCDWDYRVYGYDNGAIGLVDRSNEIHAMDGFIMKMNTDNQNVNGAGPKMIGTVYRWPIQDIYTITGADGGIGTMAERNNEIHGGRGMRLQSCDWDYRVYYDGNGNVIRAADRNAEIHDVELPEPARMGGKIALCYMGNEDGTANQSIIQNIRSIDIYDPIRVQKLDSILNLIRAATDIGIKINVSPDNMSEFSRYLPIFTVTVE